MWEKIKPYLKTYIIAIAIPLGVGLLSALITKDNMGLYSEIETPPLSPPGWLFPIAWTILYAIMGVSSALVYMNRALNIEKTRAGLTHYAISLIVNFAWSIIFFNARAFTLAFVWLILLLYLIIRTIISYRKVSSLAAYLQIPYAVWVAFAGYLNLGIVILNG